MAYGPLDAIDLRILSALQRDARLTNLALSEVAGVSPSPCLRRVRRLEESGIIEGYVTKLSASALGLGIMAFVNIRVTDHGRAKSEQFRAELTALPEVISCYILTGSTDFVAQVVASDLKEYSLIMMKIGGIYGIRDIESNIVMETAKSLAPIPLNGLELLQRRP